MLDLNLLKTLIAVIETESFSKASLRLGRSQSAISMQIKKLEESLGKSLLIRGNKKVFPNQYGRDLVIYSRKIVSLADEAFSGITKNNERGYLRIGIPDDYVGKWIPRILNKFGSIYPNYTIDLICDTSSILNKQIENDKLDVAIVTKRDNESFQILRNEPMVWVGSATTIIWQNDPLPVALYEGCTARENILKSLTRSGRKFHCCYSSASLAGMIALVNSGRAVGGMALCSVPDFLEILGESQNLPVLEDFDICINYKEYSNDKAKDSMINIIKEVISEK